MRITGIKLRCAGLLLLGGLTISSSAWGQQAPPTPANPPLPPVEVRPGAEPSGGNYVPYSESGTYDPYGNPGLAWDSDEITSDSELVGPYGQPQWTTQRPFSTTRAYVLPAGTYEFEQWVRPTWKRGEKVEYRMLEEVALGLPYRFQLDIYERWNIEQDSGGNNNAHHEGEQIELRYALADWGVIPLNPTLYAEWIERGGPQDKPNKYELKLLLAEELWGGIHFATNFVLEQETADERETELQFSMGLSKTIIERKLTAGMELVALQTTTHGNRNDPVSEVMLGPSLQYRPTNRTFLDLVALFGTNDTSPVCQMYMVFGYQFGTRAAPSDAISAPTATRGN